MCGKKVAFPVFKASHPGHLICNEFYLLYVVLVWHVGRGFLGCLEPPLMDTVWVRHTARARVTVLQCSTCSL